MFIFVIEWFSNIANHNFKVDKAMTKVYAVFRVCGGCANKKENIFELVLFINHQISGESDISP